MEEEEEEEEEEEDRRGALASRFVRKKIARVGRHRRGCARTEGAHFSPVTFARWPSVGDRKSRGRTSRKKGGG